ncbi:unnamed protein product [Thelazia callipaeda]|uniref:MSP domain-containing protein n=1 Tax=Thelazia callipaeda TaxID=103827 RepID=A0A0N5CJC3_THECL|nr:unnamed protein product [Thelazia callipaeda]
MQAKAKRRFVNTYLTEVGDLRRSINRSQLYKILIASGKDVLLSDLGSTGRLFNEFEKSRTKLINIVRQQYMQSQAAMAKLEARDSVDYISNRNKIQFDLNTTTSFSSQISRRAFCVVNNNDDRNLHYYFIVNHSQTVCIVCELLMSNDQPPERSYKNDIYVTLYNNIEEQIITITLKAVGDEFSFFARSVPFNANETEHTASAVYKFMYKEYTDV